MSLFLATEPEDLRKQFSLLTTRRDIAKLLEIDISQFVYYLYGIPEERHYFVFMIPKNKTGSREISAPITPIKIIQRKLNQVLQTVYKPSNAVHGYIKGINRGIISNAKPHVKAGVVLNIDLKDFFPYINFGRVQGLFKHAPYNFNDEVSKTLAKICCYKQSLPQGAPTSPIISNMICSRMDRQLSKLARDNDCIYTRYADDITFSCEGNQLPESIAQNEDDCLKLGNRIIDIISDNGFLINTDKVRFRTKFERQTVTGIVTNLFPNVSREYVRKIRAMLHAWEKYGLTAAESEFRVKYDVKHRINLKSPPNFQDIVKGKIDYLGMIKGKDAPIYLHFRQKLRELSPGLIKQEETPLQFLIRTSRVAPAKNVLSSVRSVGDDVHSLTHLLSSVDPNLETKRLGAWQTFYGQSNDRFGQSASTMREVINQLLWRLAPDDKVKECSWYVIPPDVRGGITRTMRVKYALCGDSTPESRSAL